ncbi:TPM domain-containing protein [Psychroserpens sp.]|uniref:TPM domain-containing protein n=1 Tax=Psychroserpens sp. TaxID=2020870 RepID=UPI002AA882B9|nr:TPM domain-containing protein [Psychroserpens sp.]
MRILRSSIHTFRIDKTTFLTCFMFLILCVQGFAQYNIPDKPSFIPPVIDSTNTLSTSEYKYLYDKLVRYNDTTSTEVMIVIIPTTKGENIGLLAPKWGHKWEIGQKNEDNGVFILLAKDDRKIWISPGYGVEDRLTAGINGTIIRGIIIPEFKNGNYFAGLDKGTDAIFDVLSGKYKAQPKSDNTIEALFPLIVLLVMVIIFIIIIIAITKNRKGGGGGGYRKKGTSLLDAIILSNMGRGSYGRSSGSSGGIWGSGSSGGGFSGGGFGGFGGGGGFSGGGAGGSW